MSVEEAARYEAIDGTDSSTGAAFDLAGYERRTAGSLRSDLMTGTTF